MRETAQAMRRLRGFMMLITCDAPAVFCDSEQVCVHEIRVGALDGMVELDALFLSKLFHEIIVKLLLVAGVLQSVSDQVDLVHIQLDVIPAAYH